MNEVLQDILIGLAPYNIDLLQHKVLKYMCSEDFYQLQQLDTFIYSQWLNSIFYNSQNSNMKNEIYIDLSELVYAIEIVNNPRLFVKVYTTIYPAAKKHKKPDHVALGIIDMGIEKPYLMSDFIRVDKDDNDFAFDLQIAINKLLESAENITKCTQCFGLLALKSSYKTADKFYACNRYPHCKHVKNTSPNSENQIMTCPTCGAEMTVRKAMKGFYAGELFWGCSAYPACTKIVKYNNPETQTSQ